MGNVVPAANTTTYVNRYFEVRERGEPVKYVFAEDRRVASASGSLSDNSRVQRLQLRVGWNLCSLTVSLSNALAQFQPGSASPVRAVYAWDPASRTSTPIIAGASLEAGAVLWINAATNCVVPVKGLWATLPPRTLDPGEHFVAAAELRGYTGALPSGTAIQRFSSETNAWFLVGPALLQGIPVTVPGLRSSEAVFIHTEEPIALSPRDAANDTRFYHPNHLESTAAVTDSQGADVERASYYPFGAYRAVSGDSHVREPYSFTQKERDPETMMHYFAARYLSSCLGRFVSPDPLVDSGNRQTPQDWNPYAYARNNPVRYVDPTGNYVWDQSLGGNAADDKVTPEVRKQRQEFRDALSAAKAAAGKLSAGADKTLLMRSLDAYGAEGTDNAVDVGYQSKAGGHVNYSGKTGRQLATFSLGMGAERIAGTVAHEGTHVADNRDFWAAAKKDRKAAKAGPLNMTEYQQEFRGFQVESILGQAMGRGKVNKADNIIWSKKWAAEDIVKNRTAAINTLLETHPQYQLTPSKPGSRMIP